MPVFELLDRRVLGALRFTDALGGPVRGPVALRPVGIAEGAFAWMRKPTGEIVVTRAPGLGAHVSAFEAPPPPPPALGSIAITLDLLPSDLRLSPRRAVIALPRSADPLAPGNVMTAREITLPPSPRAEVTGLAAGLMVTLRRDDDGRRIEGALVRARPAGGDETVALTNAAGEALLLIAGLPLAAPGPGATVQPETEVEIDAVVPLDAALFHADADLSAAREAEALRRAGFADPDALAASAGAGDPGAADPPVALAGPAAVLTAPGRVQSASLSWTPV